MVQAHSTERRVDLPCCALLGPELPPELVGDDDLLALPTGRAEELAEDDLRVAGGNRRLTGLVVVACVVQEVDAGLARRPHHGEPVAAGHPLVRPPGAECER